MTHISSLGAGLYSDLSVCVDPTENATAIASPTQTNLKACFAAELALGSAITASTGEFRRIKNVREFPSMGTPPNIVNVPVYGSATSSQIQGQADAPSMEIQLNFIASNWQGTPGSPLEYLGDYVGDNIQRVWRFSLLNSDPSAGGWASTTGELGSVQNSQWFWIGKLEALQVNPQLTDANTATATLTVQSEFYGAYTDT